MARRLVARRLGEIRLVARIKLARIKKASGKKVSWLVGKNQENRELLSGKNPAQVWLVGKNPAQVWLVGKNPDNRERIRNYTHPHLLIRLGETLVQI